MQISWPENSCDLPARGTGFRLGWKVEPGTSLFAPWPEAACLNPEKDGDGIRPRGRHFDQVSLKIVVPAIWDA